MELLDQLDAENPDDSILAPKVHILALSVKDACCRTWPSGCAFTLSMCKSTESSRWPTIKCFIHKRGQT